jgi:hypothetical protein
MLKFGMREHHSSKCLDEWLQIGVIGIGEVVIHAGAPPWPQISSASLAMATPFHCDAGYMPRPQNDVSGIFVGRNGGLNAEVHSKISFLTAAAAVLILIGIETWVAATF